MMSNLKVGVVMPHRRDRDMFLPNFHRILDSQTLKPHRIEIIDYPPIDDQVDLVPRYRLGYERMTDVDLVAFMEIDDCYSTSYLEKMVGFWKSQNKPELLGLSYTIYYHIALRKYFRFEHFNRSSMMSTVMKPNLEVHWAKETDPYLDIWLWHNQSKEWKKRIVQPPENICLGIKHGIGKCGGQYHRTHLHRYNVTDEGSNILSKVAGKEGMKFYDSLELPDFPKKSGVRF